MAYAAIAKILTEGTEPEVREEHGEYRCVDVVSFVLSPYNFLTSRRQ